MRVSEIGRHDRLDLGCRQDHQLRDVGITDDVLGESPGERTEHRGGARRQNTLRRSAQWLRPDRVQHDDAVRAELDGVRDRHIVRDRAVHQQP